MNLVRKFLLNSSSKILFYVLFFLSSFFIIISKCNITFSICIYLIVITVFLKRIIIRRKELRSLAYFNIAEDKFKSDSRIRAMQFSDAASIIIFALLLMTFKQDIFIRFGNSILGLSIFVFIFFPIFGGLSISKNNQFLKIVTILLSTFQGFIFMMFVISFVPYVLNSIVYGGLGNSISNFVLSLFELDSLITTCYVVENSLSDILVIMVLSIILSLILIKLTPAYQLDDLSTAFKSVNIFVVLIGIIIFFCVNFTCMDIKEFTNIENFTYLKHDINFIKYLNGFTKSNITNLGYVLLLPYSFNALLSSLIIEYFKKRYSKKAKSYFDKIIQTDNTCELDFFKKKYIYYCGDKNLLYILELYHLK